MKFHHHDFDDVESYLHRRAPYLLVERIVSIESRQIVTEKVVSGDEFFTSGHFPGAPIIPGAMMQESTSMHLVSS